MEKAVTWKQMVGAFMTMGAIMWTIFTTLESVRERGIREDVNNTDAQLEARIEAINARLNSCQESTDSAD